MKARKNKNGVKEGDFVEYAFRRMPIEDSYNGSVGEILEIIDNPDEFAVMARVRWTTGEVSSVPADNLYLVDYPVAKAA